MFIFFHRHKQKRKIKFKPKTELNYFQLRSDGNYLMSVLVQAVFQSFCRLPLKVWRSELMNY